MARLKWVSVSANPCPSCAALDGQVHSDEDWREFGVEPRDHRLYCQSHCSCSMHETEDPESGDLSSVPLRAGSNFERSYPMSKKVMPFLRSVPVHEKLELPARADLLPRIESGEIDHLDFSARVYGTGRNRNPYVFKDEDLAAFAASFEGQPFLRNHNTTDIDARDGTIIESVLEGQAFRQTIRLTTRRGMLDFIEGKIDRFSIGWYYDDVHCSVCNQSWFGPECNHMPGRKYKNQIAKLIFINPVGKETSAVNTPAVEGTGIDQLQEYKLELAGEVTIASKSHSVKGAIMSKKVTPQADVQENPETEERTAPDTAVYQALLESSLKASGLPQAAQKAVRKPFDKLIADGETFTPAELQEAIKEKQEEVAALSAGNSVQGPRRSASEMVNSEDQFRLAVADLLGAPRDANEAGIKVHRPRGIQELYLMATGDVSFMGGYHPEFALVSANFPQVVANAMNKVLLKSWEDFRGVYGWWEKIVTVEHFTSLQQITWLKTGTLASLPTVQERGEYLELPIGDNGETTDWTKYGGYIPITLEAMLRDDVRALKRMPTEAALGGIRNISEQVAAIFTSNSGAGPTLADDGALFNNTAVTTAGGHANLRTAALGTDFTEWDTVASAVYSQPMLVKNASGYYGIGKALAIEPRFCLVPRELKAQAEALFIPRWASSVEAVAAKGGPTYGGYVEPVTVPEWTDATDWAAVVDPTLVPGIMLGEIFGVRPQVFVAGSEIDPAMFANDESRIKVRQFLAVGVSDFRPLHKSNVAG